MAKIADVLAENNLDAYVAYDSSDNEDMRYLSGFLATDPYIYVYKKINYFFLSLLLIQCNIGAFVELTF